jgi:hypothetical protein
LEALAEEARDALGDRLRGRVGGEVRPPGRRGFERPDTVEHLAVGAPVTLASPPSRQYAADGPSTLTDGRFGSRDHHDGRWLGWSGEDLMATVELGEPMVVRRIGVSCLRAQGPWIFLPAWVEFSLSGDGQEWTILGRTEVPLERDPETAVRNVQIEVPRSSPGGGSTVSSPLPEAVRFIRIHAHNLGRLPEWHPGYPERAWLFVDELIVSG